MGRLKGSKNKKNYMPLDRMKHIVLFSGGLGSYFTTKRIIESGVDREDIILLFTDTTNEDEDLYRFMDDAEIALGIKVTKLFDGRDIWQVFKDERFLGNSRIDPCSRILKRQISKKFISKFNPKQIVVYFGYDWTEMNRFEKAQKAWLPYRIESPMCEKPYIDRDEMYRILVEEDGIELPRLYRMGFAHNNCGGGCVKAGIGHFTKLLDEFPERFNLWENNEQEVRDFIGKDVSMLKRIRKGIINNFTLAQLREERESITQQELFDIGGCGCFSDSDESI